MKSPDTGKLRCATFNVLADAYLGYGDYSHVDPALLVPGARLDALVRQVNGPLLGGVILLVFKRRIGLLWKHLKMTKGGRRSGLPKDVISPMSASL